MKTVFIPTQNYQRLEGLCQDLLEQSVGIEMATVLGRAGRGKTTAAERIVALNPDVIYVRFEERLSYVGLIREIAFQVAGIRPNRTQACFEMIDEEFKRHRRLIMVDEADRMSLKHLNTMRDFHDVCRVPVVLIGEDALKARLTRERRLVSRIRTQLTFEAVEQSDVVIFYRKAMELPLNKEWAAALLKHAQGDFRLVLKDALSIERYMAASEMKEITQELVDQVLK